MSLVSDRHLEEALPQIVEELQGLTFSLVTGAAANTEVTVESMEAEDTIAKVINLTDLTEMDLANVTVGDRRASGTLTILATVDDGDVIVVNGKTYTFTEMVEAITTNVGPNIIPIEVGPSGVDVAVVAARLAKVLMSSDSSLFATALAGVVTVVWRTVGVVGNSKTLVVTGANAHITRSAATLLGGATTNGFQSSDSSDTKKLLVIWYNKNRP